MKEKEMIWSTLLHLGTNMWRDKFAPGEPDDIHRFRDSHMFWRDELRSECLYFKKQEARNTPINQNLNKKNNNRKKSEKVLQNGIVSCKMVTGQDFACLY